MTFCKHTYSLAEPDAPNPGDMWICASPAFIRVFDDWMPISVGGSDTRGPALIDRIGESVAKHKPRVTFGGGPAEKPCVQPVYDSSIWKITDCIGTWSTPSPEAFEISADAKSAVWTYQNGTTLFTRAADAGGTYWDWVRSCRAEVKARAAARVHESDVAGIAAMAAKNTLAAPDTAALAIVHAKSAAPVTETPRGLLTVAEIDHRCGAWKG